MKNFAHAKKANFNPIKKSHWDQLSSVEKLQLVFNGTDCSLRVQSSYFSDPATFLAKCETYLVKA